MNNLNNSPYIPIYVNDDVSLGNDPSYNISSKKFSKRVAILGFLALTAPLVYLRIGMDRVVQTPFSQCVSITKPENCQFLKDNIKWAPDVFTVWENCHKTSNSSSQICNQFLEINDGIININQGVFQSTNLLNGIQMGDLEKVKDALNNGADPNRIYGNGNIIHLACEQGNREIVRELLDNGADLNSKTNMLGHTALHRACIFGHAEIVEELISRKVDVNHKSILTPLQYNYGRHPTPLEYAIGSKCYECCRLLIKAGANLKDDEDFSHSHNILTSAVSTGSYAIVKLFLDSCVNVELGDVKPLCKAASFPDILQLMLDRGANINCKNAAELITSAGNQPLHEAVLLGNVESVKILVKAKAPLTVKNAQKQTPLDIAKWKLNFELNQLHPYYSPLKVKKFQLIVTILENEYARRKKAGSIG